VKHLTVLSLFDGMSCGRLALQRAGIPVKVYYASEVDKYAIQIAKKNFPDTVHIGDVKTVIRQDLPKIDIVMGGFPCQAFSIAGKHGGMEDSRGLLFYDAVKCVRKFKPRWFLLENVKMKKEWQELISGYVGVEPIEINSSLVSGQQRRRLYWTNIPGIQQPEDRHVLLQDIIQHGTVDREKSYAIDASYWKGGSLQDYYKRCRRQRVFEEYGSRLLHPVECERCQTLPDDYTSGVSKTQRYKMIGNGWTVEVIVHILSYIKEE